MAPFAESVFEVLFKYRPFLFEKGHVVLGPPWPPAALFAVGAVVVAGSYSLARGNVRRADRAVLALLRAAALAVLVFCLCRPTLVLATVVPQQSFLGVLLDDSQSMRIADTGEPRSAFVARAFGPGAAVMKALSDRYKVRLFRFSDTADRLGSVSDLAYDGRGTSLARALERAD